MNPVIPYGKGEIAIPSWCPEPLSVIEPGPFPVRHGPGIIEQALDNPLESPPMENFFSSGQKIVCVIPDITRRSGVGTWLPLVLKRLLHAGVVSENVTIVVALGIHRKMPDGELREHVGEWVWQRFSVMNHDCDDPAGLIDLGRTPAGIPLQLNRRVVAADALLLTGSVTYHYFAGYGGGRKAILPGVASREACEANHRMVVSWRRGTLHGDLGPGKLEGNPVHSDMLSACTMVPPIFSLNVVTDPTNRVIAAAAGGIETAHVEACRLYDSFYHRRIDFKAGLVIAGVGGWPKDINFVQAHKGLNSAHRAVKEGGVLILAAACPEGGGHPDFFSWFRRCSTDEQWLDTLVRDYQINGQTAYSTWKCASANKTILISGLPREWVLEMGMVPAGGLEEAVKIAEDHFSRNRMELPRPLIIPDASDILVECGN